MTSRERIESVFAGKKPDHFPVMHIGFSSDIATRLLKREAYVGGGAQQFREACALFQGKEAHKHFLDRSLRDAIDLSRILRHDMIRYAYWRLPVKPTARVDERTFIYENGSGAHVRRYDESTELFEPVALKKSERIHILADRALSHCEDPVDPRVRFADYIEAKALVGDDIPLRVGAAGLFIPTETEWLEAVVLDPDVVAAFLDAQVERGLREIRALSELGGVYVFGGGDMASAQGPMYSPRVFERLMLPRLVRLVDECNALNMKYLFNSDGNLWPVSDMIFREAGVHGYYEIDADAGMDLERLRGAYPDVVLFGNISSAMLHCGSPRLIAETTEHCCQIARDLGRIVVGCSNQIVAGTKNENLTAMLETIRRMIDA